MRFCSLKALEDGQRKMLENLLKRISLLVPPEDDPSNRVDAYSSYIEGGTDKCPTFARDKSLNVVVKDLYYLLGDYYFKNKEFSKAIRFYLLDICVNPDRQDSWAGMALSRSSQLDQKLNSYELRNEATIYRKSSAALRCFEHALELNSATTSLWIEYGSLAYVLHSHASRQLKQDAYCDGVRDLLKNKKEEMLTAAERCFRAANQCEEGTEPEEAWLHHYMLGKISQKQEKEPKVFLDHYQKALLYLHEDEARYPRKIQYHNPPELSIEVLEVYYRIHASCLKFLSRYESEGIMLETLKIFRDCISDVATGPFANFQEKLRVESHSSSVSESETEDFIIHPAVSTDVKSPTDHNYYNEVQDMVRKGTIDYKYEDRRQSIDSSSESQDSAAVKELINALVSVVTERFIEDCREPHSDRNASLADPNIPMTQAKPENTIFNKEVEESVSEEIVSTTVTINANETPMEIDVVDKPSSEINKNNMQEISLECKASHNSSDRLTESKMLSVKLEKSANSCSEHAYTLEERLELTNYISSTPASGNSSKKIKNADSKEILSIASDKSENAVSENCKSILSCEVSNVVSEILAVIQAKEVDLSKKHVADVTEESNLNINKGDKKCDLAETALNVNSITLKSKTVMAVLDEMVCSTTDSKESVPVKEASLQQKEKEYLQNANKKQGKNEDNSLDEKGSSGSHKMSAKDREASKAEINDLILLCLDAMRECLQRFIQHYKSLYRIAYYYCHSKKNKNLQWAREILLAATPLVNNYPSMPGLFAERKNTNFFNGIWRAPSNEIDRPGSFGAHMYRSVLLLTDVLWKQRDYNMLLNLTQQLYRTPDFGKKYMRDAERTFLARESYERCVTILRDQMNSLLQEEPPPEESRLTCCLLEIYRSCQTLLKAGIYIDETNELLEEAYSMYKIGEVDPYPSVLEQAIKFCQMQLGKSYQLSHDTSRYDISTKQSLAPGEIMAEANVNVATASSNCYTPDAWQREFAKSLMLPVVPLEARGKSDIQVLQDSLILIPVDNKVASQIQAKQGCSTSSIVTQMVHVEKPRAENLRACSVAFLPVTPVFPSDNSALKSVPNNTTLISCPTFECYDILTTIMQSSGYQIASETPTKVGDVTSTSNPQCMLGKNQETQAEQNVNNSSVNIIRKRAWRKWVTKSSKLQSVSPPAQAAEVCNQNKLEITQEYNTDVKETGHYLKVEPGKISNEVIKSSSAT